MEPSITKACQIMGMLQEKHNSDEWRFFEEVSDKPGYHATRRIDAVALNVWKPRLIAYEVKVTRQDFMNELKEPRKRYTFKALCDEFYYVCPRGLIQSLEVPKGCGLIWAGARLETKKIAEQDQRKMYDPDFVTCLFRRGTEAPTKELKVFKYAGLEMTQQDILDVAKKEVEKLERSKEKLREELVAKTRIDDELPKVRALVQKFIGYPYKGSLAVWFEKQIPLLEIARELSRSDWAIRQVEDQLKEIKSILFYNKGKDPLNSK